MLIYFSIIITNKHVIVIRVPILIILIFIINMYNLLLSLFVVNKIL